MNLENFLCRGLECPESGETSQASVRHTERQSNLSVAGGWEVLQISVCHRSRWEGYQTVNPSVLYAVTASEGVAGVKQSTGEMKQTTEGCLKRG